MIVTSDGEGGQGQENPVTLADAEGFEASIDA